MALPINIEDLLNKRKVESNRIEFKEGWNPTKIYQTICAFANDFDNIGGGYILVGVEEENGIAKRPVRGLSVGELDRIQRAMIGYDHKINPYYRPRVSVEEIDGKYILVIWVPSGLDRPYDVMDDVTKRDARSRWYVRSGTSTIEARGEVLVELRDMANRTPFDDRGNSEIAIEDLSPVLIYDYLRKVKSRLVQTFSITSIEKTLEQMDLFVGPLERRYLKNVAAMMFCETPEKFFPYTQVEIVHFPGGAERDPNNMIEVPKIRGSVPTIIGATLNYLRTHIIREQIIKPKDRAESIRFFNYPYQALEEAVVNALYHRDYQVREPVEITIEPHAISILSHSGPDRSISEESIRAGRRLQARRYRNRRLGEFLKELDLSEGRATGIPTIQEELVRNGSPLATFETDIDRTYFLISIPCHPDFVHKSFSQVDVKARIKARIKDKKRKERLFALISLIKQGEISSALEIAKNLSVSSATIWRDLKVLSALGIEIKTKGKWRILATVDEVDDTLDATVATVNDTVDNDM
ncbi:RNA-binding domain-containing protein [Porphyromonas circumdentaria]|uniref:ATP-dependent DNA helicase RecG n=1 Tax=Porphyromonas circumdentaria TaxID=29524 RepID=A0A1T4LSF3_9PORP|nr:RNA-binding domain-containing protein [Porphyromonas circumdentaria]MBB6275460.1 ATP-dependent DNA helicase RecG [Porphyromonas circumdentaria]MDO4722605.1 putative DNA binding domain-containing protein [Porphyromonas circumdentaria]SJZ57448.1 ATP-dependent DNA helicase RecG [Porphyromonas circumdentaria]